MTPKLPGSRRNVGCNSEVVKGITKCIDLLLIRASGVMVRVKFRRSAGSGKTVFMVDGRSSSVKSKHGDVGSYMRKHICQI